MRRFRSSASRERAALVEQTAVEGFLTWGAWPELEMHEEEDIIFSVSDIPLPFFNSAVKPRIPEDRVKDRIEEVTARARERHVPMMWQPGAAPQPKNIARYLLSAGLDTAGSAEGMALKVDDLKTMTPAEKEVVVKRVEDEADLRAWCDTSAFIFDFPDFAWGPWNRLHEAIFSPEGLPWRHYLAYVDERIVGTASLFSGSSAAAPASVGVVEGKRRKGVGTTLSIRCIADAKELGYTTVTLFASRAGEALYRRLGFRRTFRGVYYVWYPS